MTNGGAGPDGKGQWRPARFAAVVVEELSDRIVSGALTEGDVLPTEPGLCEEFGFSRTVVREALKLLEQRGLVRVEQGRGQRCNREPRGICSTRTSCGSPSAMTTTSRSSTTSSPFAACSSGK